MSTDSPPTQNPKPIPDANPQATSTKSYGAFIAAILFGLLIIGGAGYYFWETKLSGNKQTPAPQSAAQIQQEFAPPPGFKPSFAPPTPTSGSTYNPPAPSAVNPTYTPPAQNSNPNPSNTSQRGPVPYGTGRGSAVAGAETGQQPAYQQPGYTAPPAVVAPQPVYQPYIETYPANNTTLQDIRQTLVDSSSVKSVIDTTYNGQPALRYTSYDPSGSGIAYISNGTIYYVHTGRSV